MKELIENTFEKVTDEFAKRGVNVFSQDTYLVVNKYKNVLLKEIEDQESKPFNPVEAGFTEFEIDEKERYYKIHSGLVIVIEKDEKENSFILQSFYKNYSFDESNLTKLLEEGECLTYMYFTAPNHRQGVELLRNLGRIE